jgi:hypothetical protein
MCWAGSSFAFHIHTLRGNACRSSGAVNLSSVSDEVVRDYYPKYWLSFRLE